MENSIIMQCSQIHNFFHFNKWIWILHNLATAYKETQCVTYTVEMLLLYSNIINGELNKNIKFPQTINILFLIPRITNTDFHKSPFLTKFKIKIKIACLSKSYFQKLDNKNHPNSPNTNPRKSGITLIIINVFMW